MANRTLPSARRHELVDLSIDRYAHEGGADLVGREVGGKWLHIPATAGELQRIRREGKRIEAVDLVADLFDRHVRVALRRHRHVDVNLLAAVVGAVEVEVER